MLNRRYRESVSIYFPPPHMHRGGSTRMAAYLSNLTDSLPHGEVIVREGQAWSLLKFGV